MAGGSVSLAIAVQGSGCAGATLPGDVTYWPFPSLEELPLVFTSLYPAVRAVSTQCSDVPIRVAWGAIPEAPSHVEQKRQDGPNNNSTRATNETRAVCVDSVMLQISTSRVACVN